MHDALTLEKKGKPAALVCTDQFIQTAKSMAKFQGMPDYPFAIVPHPISALEEPDLRERARAVLPTVLQLMLPQT